MTKSMSGVSNGPVNVRLTLPFLPVKALGQVSANASRPGDPDHGGTGAGLGHGPAGQGHPNRP